MAECYHNEALRKQRVIDRAAEAREKLEEKKAKKYVHKGVQVGGTSLGCDQKKSKSSCQNKHRIDKKLNEIRRDLKKQELVLRDSNLVMGHVLTEEELTLRRGKKV